MSNKSKSNILVITDAAFPLSETFIYRQILALSSVYNIHLLANSRQNNELFPIDLAGYIEFKVWLNPIDRFVSAILRRIWPNSDKLSLGFKKQIASYIKKNRIDVIQIHYGTLAVKYEPVLRQIKIPYVISFHGFDASKALRNNSYASVVSDLCKKAASNLLSSPHMADNLQLAENGAEFKVIPYGIDELEFSALSSSQSEENVVHVLHSGRITPKKGVPDLIKAASKVNLKTDRIHLHILGDGVDLDTCKNLTKDLDMSECTTFYGAQPIDKVKELMSECDVFVLNSRMAEDGDMEGLPNALLEAMSMGMAVLSTRHAGIPLAVKHMENGLLVDEFDNKGLSKMMELLITDVSLRKKLGEEGRKTIEESFSLSSMSESILEVYKELIP